MENNLYIGTAILELYPNVVSVYGDIAYDKDGNEVSYDKQVIESKAAEIKANLGVK